MICPKATTTARSSSSSIRSSIESVTGSPSSRAQALTGDGLSPEPRPRRRSGADTTQGYLKARGVQSPQRWHRNVRGAQICDSFDDVWRLGQHRFARINRLTQVIAHGRLSPPERDRKRPFSFASFSREPSRSKKVSRRVIRASLRVSSSSRSINKIPSRWSISC